LCRCENTGPGASVALGLWLQKVHDWVADQITDLFRTTHKVIAQQVDKSRGNRCGDIELATRLPREVDTKDTGPALVVDLRIDHCDERFGSSSDPSINGHLHYPNDLDGPLNEAASDKIRQYRADYINRPSNVISFMTVIASTSCLSEFVRLLFLQDHRETDNFFAVSGVQLAQSDRAQFHYRRTTFSLQLKSKVGSILAKATAIRVTLNIDGAPIASSSQTHPSHSQTSRLLTSSLSLGVPVPHATQRM
jgi:hypothetical protein